MSVEEVAERHAARQVTLGRQTSLELAKLWRQVDTGDIRGSWSTFLERALVILGTSQATAAASAGSYVDDALDEQGLPTGGEGRVNPGAFAGIASDGRPLVSLLEEPSISALSYIKKGATPERALTSGGFVLDMISRTQVADAGRVAVGTAIAARPQVEGYVRMIVGKTCKRCLILAGRWYSHNAGFKRHPRCRPGATAATFPRTRTLQAT